MTIKPVLVPDHDAVSLRALMDHFAEASTGPTRQQLAESRAAVAAAQGVAEQQVDELSVHKMLKYSDAAEKDRDALNQKWDDRTASEKEKERVLRHEKGEQRAADKIKQKTGKLPVQIGKLDRLKHAITREGVAEATGDTSFDSMMGNIVKGARYKGAAADQRADAAYGGMMNNITKNAADVAKPSADSKFEQVYSAVERILLSNNVHWDIDDDISDALKKLKIKVSDALMQKLERELTNRVSDALQYYDDSDLAEQGVAEGKKRSDRYHIVGKDGNPASLASYADQASAVKDRDEKHPGAEVRQVGPRGKIKGVSEGIMDTVKQTFNDCVVGYPMGTSDEQFIQGWARAIRAETGRDIPLEKLTQLYQDYVERSDELMQSHGTTNEEQGVTETISPASQARNAAARDYETDLLNKDNEQKQTWWQKTIDFANKTGFQIKTNPSRTKAIFINKQLGFGLQAMVKNTRDDGLTIRYGDLDGKDNFNTDLDPDEFYDEFVRLYKDAKAGRVDQGHKFPTQNQFDPEEPEQKYLRSFLKQDMVEAGRPDVMRHAGDKTIKVVKRGGRPIGEIGIDAEASEGNGQYYVKLYDGSYDAVGFDTAEEALAELKAAISEGITETADGVKYGVFAKGGSVGSQRFRDDPLKTFDTKEEATADARRRRSALSKGERGYYGMGYVVKPIKGDVEEGMIDNIKNTVRAANYDRLARRSNSQAVAGGGFAPPAQFKSLSAKGDQRAQKAQDIRKGDVEEGWKSKLAGAALAGAAAFGGGGAQANDQIAKDTQGIGQAFRSGQMAPKQYAPGEISPDQIYSHPKWRETVQAMFKKYPKNHEDDQRAMNAAREAIKQMIQQGNVREGYDAGGAYDKWDPKHPDFVKNFRKFQASNPGATLKDFVADLKKGVTESVDPVEQLRADIRRFAQ